MLIWIPVDVHGDSIGAPDPSKDPDSEMLQGTLGLPWESLGSWVSLGALWDSLDGPRDPTGSVGRPWVSWSPLGVLGIPWVDLSCVELL
jgi:hypothetical protein